MNKIIDHPHSFDLIKYPPIEQSTKYLIWPIILKILYYNKYIINILQVYYKYIVNI